VRNVYYNLTITGLSVFVAVFIGATELLVGRPAGRGRRGRVSAPASGWPSGPRRARLR